MRTAFCESSTSLILLILLTLSTTGIVTALASAALPSSGHQVKGRNSNPLDIDLSPAPPPDEGPPGARDALRNPAYLPAQIGGIVGSYAFSLVLVAILLLNLSKKRREHLRAAEEVDLWEESRSRHDYPEPFPAFRSDEGFQLGGYPAHHPRYQPQDHHQSSQSLPKGHVRNFSLPSPTDPNFQVARDPTPYILPSPDGSVRGAPGVDRDVDQSVVQKDRIMAQAQLEEMYKYVMEQEAAKQAGVEFKGPAFQPPSAAAQQKTSSSLMKKERNKPANLNLSEAKSEKTSRTSSILSALKSPLGRKKQPQGVSISSPIMTPMSGMFPQHYVGEEMGSIPPRHYAPTKPPPVPADQAHSSQRRNTGHVAPLTPPDVSPESTLSIDERIGAIAIKGKDKGIREEDVEEEYRNEQGQDSRRHDDRQSVATTEPDPVSATSETSQTPLVRSERMSGLPSSPKPGVSRFPSLTSLPSSPKPGATFSRPNAPSAVRTGGTLPLRAYESGLMSPNTYDRTVKQTVFERAGPLSPGTARTPLTGNPVPYSPYQPFSPVVPITPSLVTKADRKRMKRMEPKTPTLQMVKSDDEIW